jgi:Restriction endonuclease fold toxin 5
MAVSSENNHDEAVSIGSDRIEVRAGPVGYVCLGIGISGRVLDYAATADGAAFEAASRGALLQKSIKASLVPPGDPFLRRLVMADALLKAGFNPDEPRDDHGRWTTGGADGTAAPSHHELDTRIPGGHAATGTVSVTGEAAGSFLGELAPEALAGLETLAAGFGVGTAFLGLIFIPSNRSPIVSGTLPGRSDVTYRYDGDTGVLTLHHDGVEIFFGRSDRNGVFRDTSGAPFGRRVAGSLVLDPDAPIYHAMSNARTRSGSAVRADAETDVATDRPKLCPDPEKENIKGRSKDAVAYQSQITGLPRGLDVNLNGVRFDGCRESDGTMLEAKSAYQQFMVGPDKWIGWFTKLRGMEEQMQSQSGAAVGRRVEWHFAEKQVADYFRKYATRRKLSNVKVLWTPAAQP